MIALPHGRGSLLALVSWMRYREGCAMTEAEWFSTTSWLDLRGRIRRRKNYARKSRLFSVACCRRIADMFDEPKCDEAVAVAEQFADGEATLARLHEVVGPAHATIVLQLPILQAWARDATWRTALSDGECWNGALSCLRAVSHDATEVKAQTAL